MFKKFFAILSLVFAMSCFEEVALSELVFSDSFSNIGLLVASTPQLGGNWTQTGTVVTLPLTVANTSLSIGNTGQDAFAALANSVSAAAFGNSIVSAFTINVSGANVNGDYFMHLGDGGTQNFWQRVFIRSSSGGFQIGINPNSTTATTYGTSIFALNTTHSVQTQWDFLAGTGNDLMTVSINGTTEVSSSTWTTNSEPAAVISVNLRQGTAANAPTLVLDNLTVNTIVAVPEPSSIALIGFMGTVGLVVANRRRRTKLMLV